jgi:hypothetical protein
MSKGIQILDIGPKINGEDDSEYLAEQDTFSGNSTGHIPPRGYRMNTYGFSRTINGTGL